MPGKGERARPMKIGLVGPLDSPVTKDAHGGTEVWTHSFAEALVRRGHDVTLFATAESISSAKLLATCSAQEVLEPDSRTLSKYRFAYQNVRQALEVIVRQEEFDIIHVSSFQFQNILALSTLIKKPLFITIHGSVLGRNDLEKALTENREPNFAFISQAFAASWPPPKKARMIYNGIDVKNFPFSAAATDSFFWIGRLTEIKGPADAIKAANLAQKDLILAGSIRDPQYYREEITPLLTPGIRAVGELTLAAKQEYYQKAKALLAPIKWEEPFGLTVVEAMACGTPVIAYRRGAMEELITDSETGYLVEPNDIQGLAEAMKKISALSESNYLAMRQRCRQVVEEKFTIEIMADAYEEYYQSANQ